MRAQAKLVLPPLFIAILGFGVVALSIFYSVTSIANPESYKGNLLATGIGLDLQAIQGIGHDINSIRTMKNPGKYSIFFEGTSVYVANGETKRFVFTQAPGFVFVSQSFNNSDITLYKTDKQFGATKQENVRPYLLTCDATPGPSMNTIALDPGHGYDEVRKEGSKGEDIPALAMAESEYNLQLANRMKTAGKFTLTRESEKDVPIEQRQNTPGNAIISLHVGKYPDSRDIVKAYYTTETGSKKLACEILNAITQSLNVPVRLIPINSEYLSNDDPKQAVFGKRPGVLLEIGNAQYKDSIVSKVSELRTAITKGIEQYG